MVREEDIDRLRIRYPMLGSGEISIILAALQLNKQNKKYYAVIDDKKARKIAEEKEVNFTGTYGLLKALIEKNLITEEQFNECKTAMENSNFRIDLNKVK